MIYNKTVLLPIKVPVGKYCWGRETDCEHTRICEHFTNEHLGYPECTLLAYFICDPLQYDKEGRVLKPKECLDLINDKGDKND